MSRLKDQRKIGVMMGYITIVANTLIGIFFTPFLIQCLGDNQYGVYKIVASFSGYLNLLNFGTSTIIARYIAKFSVTKEKKEQENFLAMMFIITAVLSVFMLILGAGMMFLIEPIYGKKFNAEELKLAKELFVILILNVVLTIIDNTINGIQVGYEKFLFTKSIKLFKVVARTLAMLVLLIMGKKALAIVISDFAVAVMILIIALIQAFGVMKVKVKYRYFSKPIFKECLSFSFANILQAVVNLVNQNLDLIILGAMVEPSLVTVYSLALMLFTMFNSLSDVVTGVFLPQVTKMITRGASGEELTDFVIKVGRISMVISGAVAFGFLMFGKDFLTCWMGVKYLDAYWCTILLIFPMMINFAQGICVSILNAYMKKMFRSCVLAGVAIFNAISTIILVKYIGIIGAAIATSLSVILGHIVVMNIYYQKVIHLNVLRMFKGFFKGILPSLVITSIVCIPASLFIKNGSWIFLILKVLLFVVLLVAQLWLYGFNESEKQLCKSTLKKINIFKKIRGK